MDASSDTEDRIENSTWKPFRINLAILGAYCVLLSVLESFSGKRGDGLQESIFFIVILLAFHLLINLVLFLIALFGKKGNAWIYLLSIFALLFLGIFVCLVISGIANRLGVTPHGPII
jgi:high-affinity Fe2+/Pb2+ permease